MQINIPTEKVIDAGKRGIGKIKGKVRSFKKLPKWSWYAIGVGCAAIIAGGIVQTGISCN